MRPGFGPWIGKISWRRARQPTSSIPGESQRQRSLVGYNLQGSKELDTEATQYKCRYLNSNPWVVATLLYNIAFVAIRMKSDNVYKLPSTVHRKQQVWEEKCMNIQRSHQWNFFLSRIFLHQEMEVPEADIWTERHMDSSEKPQKNQWLLKTISLQIYCCCCC